MPLQNIFKENSKLVVFFNLVFFFLKIFHIQMNSLSILPHHKNDINDNYYYYYLSKSNRAEL